MLPDARVLPPLALALTSSPLAMRCHLRQCCARWCLSPVMPVVAAVLSRVAFSAVGVSAVELCSWKLYDGFRGRCDGRIKSEDRLLGVGVQAAAVR
jgi:hypothetical protein